MVKIFSIIVLLYNNQEYLKECLDSILCQDYPKIEIVVVDDGSKNFEQEKIISYIQKNKKENIVNFCVYQNENNLGTVKSANGALSKAHGSYFKLLAADDALYDSKTLYNASLALEKSGDGIITSDVMNCDENLRPIFPNKKRLPKLVNELSPSEVFRRLCIHNDIVAGGVFFSKDFFKQYGYFDESFRLMEDWPTWLYATKNGCKFYYSPFYALLYRSNGGIGTSVNPLYMADKKRVLETIIIPSKKDIGIVSYIKSRISFMIINSTFIRRIYSILFRKGK